MQVDKDQNGPKTHRYERVDLWIDESIMHDCEGKQFVIEGDRYNEDGALLRHRCAACGEAYEILVADIDFSVLNGERAHVLQETLKTKEGRDRLAIVLSSRPWHACLICGKTRIKVGLVCETCKKLAGLDGAEV